MLIYLIGMMGSGKTTIGKYLSDILGYEFVDTDELIELMQDKSIAEIINHSGIDEFRRCESDVLRKTNLNINTVISTGGGIILSSENRRFMKNNGVVVYLKTSVEVLEKRIDKDDIVKRPLLKTSNLRDIYLIRENFYEESAELTILCDNLSVEDICKSIILKLA